MFFLEKTFTENKKSISQDIDLYLKKEKNIHLNNRTIRLYLICSVINYAALILALITMLYMYIEESKTLNFIINTVGQELSSSIYIAESPSVSLVILAALMIAAVLSIIGLIHLRKSLFVKYITITKEI